MKILVTGFTPFGGETLNPSWEAVRALDDSIAGADIIKCEIPTEFEASIAVLKAAIDAHQPNAILCVGQFGGSPSIQIERVAINLRDARIPDNAGFQPHDQPVVGSAPDAHPHDTAESPDATNAQSAAELHGAANTHGAIVAPDAFFATIPTRQIADRLRAAGIPAALSYSAGTYVCNNLLYAALYESSRADRKSAARCGFIHVPYLPNQAAAAVSNAPSMSLELMVQALTISVETIAECR